jgi:Ca2+-binding EF-hand superfamily protein
MKLHFCCSLLLLAGLGVFPSRLASAEPDLSKLPPAAKKDGLTYEKDIRPLFEASCFGCHGERRQRAGLRLDSHEAALKGGDEGAVIVPGKSKDSLLVVAVAQLDDETAMPPKRGRGGFGFGGPGGTNRPGGFGLGGFFGGPMFTQADTDKDKRVSKSEFASLAGAWFDKLDTKKAGKLSQDEFTEKFPELIPSAGGGFGGFGGGRGPGGQRGGDEGPGFGPAGFLGRGLFSSSDDNKDGSLSKSELTASFEKWFDEMDADKSGALSEEKFRDSLNTTLMARLGRGAGPGGMGGMGGMGGFGFGRTALAQQMLSQGDKDKDAKLSPSEFTSLAEVWYDKLDNDKSGKVTKQQFDERIGEIWGVPSGGGGAGRGRAEAPAAAGGVPRGGRGAGGVGSVGAGFFTLADGDKDGSLTRVELKSTFEKWYAAWDSDKSASMNEEKLYAGLSAALPRPEFGGFGGGGAGGAGGPGGAQQRGRGPGGPGGPGGAGGPGGGFGGFGGGGGTPPPPLTAEQVGLVRAWIDQGAK